MGFKWKDALMHGGAMGWSQDVSKKMFGDKHFINDSADTAASAMTGMPVGGMRNMFFRGRNETQGSPRGGMMNLFSRGGSRGGGSIAMPGSPETSAGGGGIDFATIFNLLKMSGQM